MSKIKFAIVLLALTTSALAQNWPMPGASNEPPVYCTGCTGTNSSGQNNNGLPTWPYPVSPFDFTGRFLDSYQTGNVQNAGMRTIRARTVRSVPSRNRLYIQGGETVFVYSLNTFFASRLPGGMIPLNTIHATPAGSQGWGGRNGVYERILPPDAFFYAEDLASGWTTVPVDTQRMLNDYDLDDRGYLYVTTVANGWGIHEDDGRTNGEHLPFVYQDVMASYVFNLLFVIRDGANYYLAGSENFMNRIRIFDVTNPAAPLPLGTRTGSWIRAFAKDDAAQRLAISDSTGKLRVYSYAGFAANQAPLAEYAAGAGGTFAHVTFDDSGNVWAAESPETGTGTLVKLDASTLAKTTFAFGSSFRGLKIHASGGYLAVMGFDLSANGYGVRLYDARSTAPVEIATDDFVRKYYFRAPSGYANMWLYAEAAGVRIVKHGAKTYLMVSAGGLGDVFEVPVIDTRITSINPASGPPSGGTAVTILGLNLDPGTPTVTFDGVNATSVTTILGGVTAVAPAHAPGAVNVVVQYTGAAPMTAPQPFTYVLEAPQNFAATGSGVSVNMTWSAVTGATSYEVSRYVGNAWQVLSTQAGTGYTDGGVSSAQTYAYRVRALDGTNSSAYATDFASTMPMTTNVTAGMAILASHLIDVQNGVNAVRAAAGLSASSFPGVSAGTLIGRADVLLPRNALNEARTALGFAPLTYTDGYPMTVRAVHVQELLDAVR